MGTSSIGQAPRDVDALVSDKAMPVLIDCYTPGCGPCAALGPVLDELAGDMQGRLVVEKIDVAAQPDVARRFGVWGVPTLLLFKEGQLQATRTGPASRTQLLTWLSANGAF
jgi:thioredoxin 1